MRIEDTEHIIARAEHAIIRAKRQEKRAWDDALVAKAAIFRKSNPELSPQQCYERICRGDYADPLVQHALRRYLELDREGIVQAEPDESSDLEDDAPTPATRQRGEYEPNAPGAGNGTGTRSRMGRALNVHAPGAGHEVRETVGKAVAWQAIEDEAARLIEKSAVSISKHKAINIVMDRRPDLVRAYNNA